MDKAHHIAIIGAGLAGLSAAYQLASQCRAKALNGQEITISLIDKSRGLGGRLANRRLPNGAGFNHGAQYVRAGTSRFRELMERACRHEHAIRWADPITDGPPPEADTDRPRYVGAPGMSALGRFMFSEADRQAKACGIEIARYRQTEITELARTTHGEHGWLLMDHLGTQLGPFDSVIIAIPAPQAGHLLTALDAGETPSLAPLLKATETGMVPCWSTMVGFDTALASAQDAWQPPDSPLVWVGRGVRADTADSPADWHGYILHADPDWTRTHLAKSAAKIGPMMLDLLANAMGKPLPEHIHLSSHLWRYAFAPTASGQPCHMASDIRLVLAGDWCLGNRAESAFESGIAAGNAVIDTMLQVS